MKKSIRLFIAALAVSMTFASCTDNLVPADKSIDNAPAAEGKRVITVSFDAPTKTTVSETDYGFRPMFRDGDEIKVSNGEKMEICKVFVDNNGTAAFSTNLEGDLKAVYPVCAADVDAAGLTWNIPDSQSGKFADANIATAEISAEDNYALFKNQTAILRFYVDKSIGVKSLKVNYLIGSFGFFEIIDPDGDVTLDEVTDDPEKRICYVALPPQAKIISIESETTTQGIVTKSFNSPTVEAGVIYDAFIPYYIDLGDYWKWGYCNIGAFLPEEPGDYFAWGETTGHVVNTDFSEYCFDWEHSPFSNGVVNRDNWDSDYFASLDVITDYGIKKDYDAAYINWGEDWCIPTDYMFRNLPNANYSFDGNNLVISSNDNKLVIPATGYVNDHNLSESNVGYYWTSYLTEDLRSAILFKFDSTDKTDNPIELGCFSRHIGMPIRPIVYSEPQ